MEGGLVGADDFSLFGTPKNPIFGLSGVSGVGKGEKPLPEQPQASSTDSS